MTQAAPPAHSDHLAFSVARLHQRLNEQRYAKHHSVSRGANAELCVVAVEDELKAT